MKYNQHSKDDMQATTVIVIIALMRSQFIDATYIIFALVLSKLIRVSCHSCTNDSKKFCCERIGINNENVSYHLPNNGFEQCS